jgi:hypothetical protein
MRFSCENSLEEFICSIIDLVRALSRTDQSWEKLTKFRNYLFDIQQSLWLDLSVRLISQVT